MQIDVRDIKFEADLELPTAYQGRYAYSRGSLARKFTAMVNGEKAVVIYPADISWQTLVEDPEFDHEEHMNVWVREDFENLARGYGFGRDRDPEPSKDDPEPNPLFWPPKGTASSGAAGRLEG
jgi:hypothetical protein